MNKYREGAPIFGASDFLLCRSILAPLLNSSICCVLCVQESHRPLRIVKAGFKVPLPGLASSFSRRQDPQLEHKMDSQLHKDEPNLRDDYGEERDFMKEEDREKAKSFDKSKRTKDI